MNRAFIRFILLFLVIFGAASYYIGLRTWQAFGKHLALPLQVYWLILAFLTLSPIINKLWSSYYPRSVHKGMATLSAYWLAVTYFAFLAWLLTDIISLFTALFQPSGQPRIGTLHGLAVWTAVFALIGYGTWLGRHPIVKEYSVTINKKSGNLTALHALLVSDLHLGPIIDNTRLTALVRQINQLQPDIVFLAGDTIDENVDYFTGKRMPETLRKLKTKFGVFAVLGNHEYIGGQAEKAVTYLQHAGINVLRDNYIKVNESFYVVGRDDKIKAQLTGRPRMPLARILQGVDKSLPILLLDHQPLNLSEPAQQGIDLQLSGHTHRGQFFPNNLITKRIFEVDWGYLQKGTFQIIVSAGCATWGPPIRLGSRPELVSIMINFVEPDHNKQ